MPEIDTTALENEIAALDTRLEGLAGRLDASDPAPRLDRVESRLTRLAREIASAADTGAVEANIADLAARLSGIEARLAEHDPDATGRALAAIEGRLDAIAADLPPAVDGTALEARIAALDARLDEIADRLPPRPATQPQAAETTDQDDAASRDGIAIRVTEAAWLRLRAGPRTLFEGTLPANERLEVPPDLDAPTLRAGNAGAVYLEVGGELFGPLGRPDQIVRNVALRAAEIRRRFPRAGQGALGEGASG